MKNKKTKLVIASGKGGVGKSMLVSTLAMLFSKTKKIVVVDCDADAPNLGIWLGGVKKWDKTIPVVASARPKIDYNKCDGCGLCAKKCNFSAIEMIKGKPQVNPFLCEGCGACEVVCPRGAIKLKPVQNGEIKIKKTKYGFPLVSGQLYPGESGSGKVVDRTKLEAEKFNYDIMLIDSAPGTGCPVTAALRDANFMVLVTEPTSSGFSDLKRVLEVVNHFKIPYGIVINKWDINQEVSNKIKKFAKNKFLDKISYDKKIFKAISNLTPIMETNLKTKKEIKKIFKELKTLW
jgi:MinD superfamily P-loop ATPase